MLFFYILCVEIRFLFFFDVNKRVFGIKKSLKI